MIPKLFKNTAWLLCLSLALCAGQAQAQAAKSARSTSLVNIDGKSYYVHTVRQGETLYSLGKLYDVMEADILRNNPQVAEGLREDQILKIPVRDEKPLSDRQQARRFDTHTVQKGETAYSISRTYGISVQTLIEDNKDLDPTQLAVGQQLNIRKSDKGSQSVEQINRQWTDYAEAMGSVTPGTGYHLVQPGETLYSISRKYGVPQQLIVQVNDIGESAIKAGSMLKIPQLDFAAEGPGDTSVTPPGTMPEDTGGLLDGLFGSKDQDPKRYEGGPVNLALMLPMSGTNEGGSSTGRNFLEFYQGVLIALEDLKRQGISTQVNLYDTQRSVESIEQHVNSFDFSHTDLIIGPVYEESLSPVLRYAREHRVAVISPLAQLDNVSSPLLYQLAPAPEHKYDKLRSVISSDKNVVLVSGSANDTEFEKEITPLLPAGCRRFNYSKGMSPGALDDFIRGERETVLVVVIKDEYLIDDMMARLSSVRNNLLARGAKVGQITVVGSSRWQRFSIADRNLFFKLNLCFIATYHGDRSNKVVMDFNRRYISSFGAMPSLYSYRGYDAAKLFVSTWVRREAGQSFEEALNLSTLPLLQMHYHFHQDQRAATHANTEWALVCYRNDYSIEVK